MHTGNFNGRLHLQHMQGAAACEQVTHPLTWFHEPAPRAERIGVFRRGTATGGSQKRWQPYQNDMPKPVHSTLPHPNTLVLEGARNSEFSTPMHTNASRYIATSLHIGCRSMLKTVPPVECVGISSCSDIEKL